MASPTFRVREPEVDAVTSDKGIDEPFDTHPTPAITTQSPVSSPILLQSVALDHDASHVLVDRRHSYSLSCPRKGLLGLAEDLVVLSTMCIGQI